MNGLYYYLFMLLFAGAQHENMRCPNNEIIAVHAQKIKRMIWSMNYGALCILRDVKDELNFRIYRQIYGIAEHNL